MIRRSAARIREFLRLEASGGILLIAAAGLALLLANSPLARFYEDLFRVRLEIRIGDLEIAKPLLLWINDGLMAVFFLLVGLEIKREVLVGELSSLRRASLPVVAAIGGMVVPALVYLFLNLGSPATRNGWAIPAATDIAFALGVLALLGTRVPASLKVFLLALAIIDDLGAIILIAVLFTADLGLVSFGLALLGLIGLYLLNRRGVTRLAPYLLIGAAIWVCVLKSGVHATLAGVAVACFVPLRAKNAHGASPLRRLEHSLHPWVAFGIMPLFAFANAGVSFAGVTPGALFEPLSAGIAGGLFLGKQAGVMGAGFAAVRLKLCRLPEGVGWGTFYGVALLTGIGFTMSLFIGTLAFGDPAHAAGIRLGVIVGSVLSAVAGYLVLRMRSAPPAG